MSVSQPLLFTSTSVPILDSARYSHRRQGDGMDSEALSSVQQSTVTAAPVRRHTNLNDTDRSTTFTKETSPNFIPREPVKGAVKPVVPASQPGNTDANRHVQYCPPTFQEYLRNKTTSKGLTAPSPIKNTALAPTVSQAPVSAKSTLPVSNGSLVSNNTVKQVKVPVYNAPSHLSQNTYKLLKNIDLQKEREQKKDTIIAIQNDSSLNEPAAERIDGVKFEMRESERQVEGQQTVSYETEKLEKDLRRAKEELEVQIKVNADLKKLLVASVGDDLHYKVETLVRTKAHLVEEIGGYTKKMTQDYEDIDQLSIQADMWRTKYMASKVLVDQLASSKDDLEKKWTDAERALKHMLLEREQLNDWLIESHRHLKLTRDSFDPPKAQRPPPCIPNMLELARDNLLQSESIKFRLLGSMTAFPAALDAGIQNGPTPAEKLAYQVISNSTDGPILPGTVTTQGCLPNQLLTRMERFHPKARYDNITFNCCRKCKGQIQVV